MGFLQMLLNEWKNTLIKLRLITYDYFTKVIIHCNNKLVWIMMSSIFSLFLLQDSQKLDLEVLYFGMFSETSYL